MEKLNKEQLEAVIDSFREYVVKSDVIFLDALKEKGLIEEFIVGKWYKHDDYLFCIESIENDWIEMYSVSGKKDSASAKYRKVTATDSEVSTALIAEAKKRGFKEGVKYQNASSGSEDIVECKKDNNYYSGNNQMCSGGGSIFLRGKWATIIEEEKEFLIQVQKGTIIIEGKEYTAEEIINKFNK